ncbi:MAG: hypothetical protein KJ558_00585 [Gammaproteobacteria bacterium]|nr:hypothetical protein [Gammaproteobacteria bacterium]MBU1653333.1 hypothetical protein [Gammaproteobacteria bacterium]MBU1962525.1 hypothetical protein [Gammaproteobacteria bacterium]
MSHGLEIAVLGAVGLNGDNLLQLIAKRGLPVARLHALDSGDCLGRKVDFGGKLLPLDDYRDFSFAGIDLAIACSPLPAEVVERIGEQGCTLLGPVDTLPDAGDGSPLILADVNGDRMAPAKGATILAPSALPSVLASLLSPLHDEAGLREVNATWIGPVSNDGQRAVEGLALETAQLLGGKPAEARAYSEKIAFNLLARGADGEADAFRSLWGSLWGEGLEFSFAYAVAPLFFGDLISLTLTLDQSMDELSFRRLLSSPPWAREVKASGPFELSSARGIGGDKVLFGGIRVLNERGDRFGFWAGLDGQRFGLALNLTKIAEILAKNLFISYS